MVSEHEAIALIFSTFVQESSCSLVDEDYVSESDYNTETTWCPLETRLDCCGENIFSPRRDFASGEFSFHHADFALAGKPFFLAAARLFFTLRAIALRFRF